jgi:hypothetical protein
MKMTVENLLRIDGATIYTQFGDLTYINVHKDSKIIIEYFYNSKFDVWVASLIVKNCPKVNLNAFETVDEVIRQIYYITGFYHGIHTK